MVHQKKLRNSDGEIKDGYVTVELPSSNLKNKFASRGQQ